MHRFALLYNFLWYFSNYLKPEIKFSVSTIELLYFTFEYNRKLLHSFVRANWKDNLNKILYSGLKRQLPFCLYTAKIIHSSQSSLLKRSGIPDKNVGTPGKLSPFPPTYNVENRFFFPFSRKNATFCTIHYGGWGIRDPA